MLFISNMYLTVQTAIPGQTASQTVTDLVLNASPVAKVVLGILSFFSVISWGIIISKLRVFARVNRESNKFLNLFSEGKHIREILQASKQYPSNPFAAIFKESYWFFNKGESQSQNPGGVSEPMRESPPKSTHSSEDLVRLFDSVASREVLNLERHLVFLATTGSVCPFFGLFGTVWGVMSSFLAIGVVGAADISVVGPGIAEALITTIAGLGAAIPAVIAYNHFVNKLKILSSEIEIFYSNLVDKLARRESGEKR